MADSGGTQGTPIQPGSPTGFDIAEPLKFTHLSLPYYAKIMGISPVHFQGAITNTVFPITRNSCQDLWPRYSWQSSDRVSHEDLSRAIYDAEQEIAQVLHHFVAPTWVAQEVHRFPLFYRRDLFKRGALNNRGARASLRTKWGKVIAPGQRDLTPIGTATVTGNSLAYTDEDGDGFAETATVELATTLTDACEIKVYFSETGGAQEWEIREPRSKSISNGTVTLVFDSWLFINPDLQSTYPTNEGFTAIDISTITNYVSSVDVYREFNDTTETSATFYWEPDPPATNVFCGTCGGVGCEACVLTTQDGCLYIRNAELGEVVPQPATYSVSDTQWGGAAFTVCRDPDMVKLWYYAGQYDNRFLTGQSCQPLANDMARTIANLATARLERPFCSCANVTALAEHLRVDLAHAGEVSFQIPPEDLSNPFGTRRGEIMAWRKISKLTPRRMTGVAV
jgi:hypothetical protein